MTVNLHPQQYPNPYFLPSFLESRQQAVDVIQCHEEVKQANTDRDILAKKSARKISSLERQALDLIEDRERNESKLEMKLRDLEKDERSIVKDKRQLLLDEVALENQQSRCRDETTRLENRATIVREERQKLKCLMSEGVKLIHKAVEDQTQALNVTTQVSNSLATVFCSVLYVRFANFFVCQGSAKQSGKA